MAVTKQQKVEILNELVAKFKEAKSIGFASTTTLTVSDFAKLRGSLREQDATYTLAKKTLMKKALKEALGLDIDLSTLTGQIGAVCSNDDAMAGLGKVNDFIKEINGKKGDLGKMAWASSVVEGEIKTLEETKVLAGLPSKETLLGRLVGSMKSPISGLARFFDAASKDLEAKGKTTVAELKVEVPAKEEVKAEEAPKVEEVKAEAPTEEIKEEAKTEEK